MLGKFIYAILVLLLAASPQLLSARDKPNIIFIMVDDMGYYDLGCYGGKTIQTPNLDQLAAAGMRFTDAYSGCTVCASARSTLLTGTHKGHTPVRGNSGGIPLVPDDITIAEILKKAGYVTGGFGKWGLGNQGKDGAAERQGFDEFFGYYNQWHAHTYYTHLFRNSEKVELNGRYTHHAIFDETMKFLERHHESPFFLYCPWTPPHSAYQIPEDEPAWQLYRDKPWKHDAKCAAAMITMMDRQIGEMVAFLKKKGIDKDTLIFFTSDNGAAKRFEGVHNSCGAMQGHKRSLHEGGIRVPMIASWPGEIPEGVVSQYPWYFPDVLPTLAELVGLGDQIPDVVDGVSISPTLTGYGTPVKRDYMFWEFGGNKAVRSGNWKLIQTKAGKVSLFDLSSDLPEANNLATKNPELVAKLKGYIQAAYQPPRSQKDDGKYTGKPPKAKKQ